MECTCQVRPFKKESAIVDTQLHLLIININVRRVVVKTYGSVNKKVINVDKKYRRPLTLLYELLGRLDGYDKEKDVDVLLHAVVDIMSAAVKEVKIKVSRSTLVWEASCVIYLAVRILPMDRHFLMTCTDVDDPSAWVNTFLPRYSRSANFILEKLIKYGYVHFQK